MTNEIMTDDIMVILTAILVVITGIYAYLTNKIAIANKASVDTIREQSEAMLRPYISVASFVNALVLYLKIENLGRTAAENVKLSIDRDFYQFGDSDNSERNLRAKSVFTTPVDSLPPGGQLIFALGQGYVIFGADARPEVTPTQFNITASYEFFGKQVEEVSRIDLRPYLGSEERKDPIVGELEKLREVLGKDKV